MLGLQAQIDGQRPIHHRNIRTRKDIPKGSLRGKSRDGCTSVVGSAEGHLKEKGHEIMACSRTYVRKLFTVLPHQDWMVLIPIYGYKVILVGQDHP